MLKGMVLCFGLSAALTAPAAAIIGGFTPDEEDQRFDAVCALIAWSHWGPNCASNPCDYDLCCDDVTCNWTRCSGTLIAPNLVLLAGHCASGGPGPNPAVNWGFRFRRKPDGSVGQVDLNLPDHGASSFHHVRVQCFIESPNGGWNGGGPDMRLAVLQEPVLHIKPIPVRFATPQDLPPGSPIFCAGWGTEHAGVWEPGEFCAPATCSFRLKVAAQVVADHDATSLLWSPVCSPFVPVPGALGIPFLGDSGGPVLAASQTCADRFEVVAIHQTTAMGPTLSQVQNDPSFPIPSCPADLNGSCTVDPADLALLLGAWEATCSQHACPADLNCDDHIDAADLALLLGTWGECGGLCHNCPEAAAQSSMQASTLSGEDFYLWALQATIEDLLDWATNGNWQSQEEE